jgi:hypothetical protein
MSKWGWAARIGGYAAAPFTAGFSIPAGNLAASAIEKAQGANDPKGPNGGDDSADDEEGINPLLERLKSSSDGLRGKAAGLGDMSEGALGPVLQYLQQLQNGGSDLMAATMTERGRVIDQYDGARKAISQFGPRGGGQTGALAESRIAQGNALSDVTSNALTEGRKLASTLGLSLGGQALNAEQLASADIDSVIRAILGQESLDVQKRGQTMAMWGGIGEAAGTILGDIILGGDDKS